ncbi:MAG: type II secretion system F family protein [Rhodocyclales bacterium]|nr:type II secretion system F family protein [Rhodocyclales bacterium]
MRFEITAMRGMSGLTALALEAGDAAEAARQAAAQGYKVISVRSARKGWRLPSLPSAGFPLVQFSQELQFLLQAGLTLTEAVATLADREQRAENRATLARIVQSLQQGLPFSQALRQCTGDIPALFIASIQASEKTGAVAEALARYVAYQLQVDRVRRQVVSASIYPMLLGIVGGLVALFMLGFVVPRFSHIYADVGRDLPMLSRWLMHWGQFIADHTYAALGGFVLFVALAAAAVIRPASRQRLLRLLWLLPAVGARMHDYQLARFYRSLGMLLRGGMPIVAALQMAMDLLHGTLRMQLVRATADIREGQPISRAMERHQLTTSVAFRLLMVGERTGQMGDMMERIAEFHEDETARWVESFTRLFEPLLMVFIGGVIGLIVLLMYFPIFDLAGTIQ